MRAAGDDPGHPHDREGLGNDVEAEVRHGEAGSGFVRASEVWGL